MTLLHVSSVPASKDGSLSALGLVIEDLEEDSDFQVSVQDVRELSGILSTVQNSLRACLPGRRINLHLEIL